MLMKEQFTINSSEVRKLTLTATNLQQKCTGEASDSHANTHCGAQQYSGPEESPYPNPRNDGRWYGITCGVLAISPPDYCKN